MKIPFSDKISHLIVSHLDGKLKDGEKQFLQQWRTKSEENNALFLKLTSSEFINKLPHKKEELERDMASEWIRLKNRMSRKQKIRKLSYWISSSAAALLLLLAVGTLFDFNDLYDKNPFAKNEPLVLAGSSKAILQLADGKEILLRSDSVLYMLKNRQVIVNKDDTIPVNQIENDKSPQYNTIIVPKGGEYTAVLEDGSKIYLNSDTRAKIPVAFEDDSRKLILEKGEAYFEIAKDKKRPFIMEISGASIKVLGTEFNVRNYPSEDFIATTLVEGSVQISSSFSSSVLKPGEQAVLGIDGKLTVAAVNTYPYIAWKEGRMVFENKELDGIMEELSRWYDFEVEYKGIDAKAFRFTIDIVKYESLNEILGLFKEMDKVGFDIKDKKVTVSRLN